MLAHFQVVPLEHRQHQLVGSARISGGLENNQHSSVKMPGDLLAGADDVAHVRVFCLAERRGYADIDGDEGRNGTEIRGGPELPGPYQRLQRGGGHVLYIRFPAVDRVHFGPESSGPPRISVPWRPSTQST